MFTVKAQKSEDAEAAKLAQAILDHYNALTNVDNEVVEEVARQVIHGLPPSEGLPDVRPCCLRYES